jgi:hypothetical protein
MTNHHVELVPDADEGDYAEGHPLARDSAVAPDTADDADALEQQIDIDPADDDEPLPAQLPPEADPADVAEQRLGVPAADDDEPRP